MHQLPIHITATEFHQYEWQVQTEKPGPNFYLRSYSTLCHKHNVIAPHINAATLWFGEWQKIKTKKIPNSNVKGFPQKDQ